MDKIKRLAARLRRGAKEPRQPLLSEEMDIEYAVLAKEVAEKIDNHFDVAGFVVAVLRESGMYADATAVSRLLAGSEVVQAGRGLAEGTPYLERPTECKRCGSELRKGYCTDGTCPFSDRLQSDPEGWHGHPDHPTASYRAGTPPLEKTWYCHGCGIRASARHPLRDAKGAATGTPACGSCGRPMTTEMPDQSWNPPILFGTNLRLLNEALSADAVRRLNNAWDVASFVVAMLRKVDLISEADAVGRILAGSEKVNKAKKERPEFSEPTSAKRLEARGRRTGQVETGPRPGTTPGDSMTWYCHDCGTSKRHPLADGCPACVECGKSMVSDSHLKDRDGPIRGGGPPQHLKDRR